MLKILPNLLILNPPTAIISKSGRIVAQWTTFLLTSIVCNNSIFYREYILIVRSPPPVMNLSLSFKDFKKYISGSVDFMWWSNTVFYFVDIYQTVTKPQSVAVIKWSELSDSNICLMFFYSVIKLPSFLLLGYFNYLFLKSSLSKQFKSLLFLTGAKLLYRFTFNDLSTFISYTGAVYLCFSSSFPLTDGNSNTYLFGLKNWFCSLKEFSSSPPFSYIVWKVLHSLLLFPSKL